MSEREMERFGMSACPFCGDVPCLADNETKERYADTWFVICEECGAKGPAEWDGSGDWQPRTREKEECMDAAVRAWNRRTPEATHLREVNAALVEAVRQFLRIADEPNGDDVCQMLEYGEAVENMRAALARATTQEQGR